MGYTKIHHYLVDNDYEVGKSRTVVDSMIKKRIKRERTLNQPIIINKFVDFRMEVLRNWNIKWNTSNETRIVKSVKDIVHEIQKKI